VIQVSVCFVTVGRSLRYKKLLVYNISKKSKIHQKSNCYWQWYTFKVIVNWHVCLLCLTPLSTIFQLTYIVAVSFIGGENRSTLRKPLTCRKLLTNFIIWCCIEYTSPWTGFERTTLVVIGTDCTYDLDHDGPLNRHDPLPWFNTTIMVFNP